MVTVIKRYQNLVVTLAIRTLKFHTTSVVSDLAANPKGRPILLLHVVDELLSHQRLQRTNLTVNYITHKEFIQDS
jgi:hypothetical protein